MTFAGDAEALATWSEGAGPRLVLAHGFTQTARTWGPLLASLAAHRQVVAVDLPGHGRSAPVRADLERTAVLLGEAGGEADYLGYSLGGRVALHLALARPELVRRLVLIGATAGIEDDAARAARRAADGALADGLEEAAARDPAGALHEFLARWLAGPLFATLAPGDAQLEGRRANDAIALASSLRLCGTGTQAPLWDRLGSLAMPVLVVAGILDERFAATGRRMARAIGPNATLALVPGAGHACHLERPAATARIVEAFLA
ncbi:MAG TPA: alpha/beta fold hydrolase [Acidimicrobiales bacterium]|nr:alpha/beta fold hydrolase [Acidimicrobiales bacterium]